MVTRCRAKSLQRTAAGRRGCNRRASLPPSLSSSRWRMKTPAILAAIITFAAVSLAQTNTTATLYVHFGYESSDSTRRLLSARIHLGEPIFVAGEEHWELMGSIERHGTNLVADLRGNTGSQDQFYKGVVTLEKPFYAQGGAASGGVVPLWFAISTNSDSKPLLESLKKSTRERLQRIK